MSGASLDKHGSFVAIARAPNGSSSVYQENEDHDLSDHHMPYSCQPCAKRKVKCDKAIPLCTSCRKGKLECFYQAPNPRKRKRETGEELRAKLHMYERILHQHGLLSSEDENSVVAETALAASEEALPPESGKLVTDQGRTRYIDGRLWHDIDDDEIDYMSEDNVEDHEQHDVNDDHLLDPLTGSFIGASRNLLRFYPTPVEAERMWHVYVENVEPICKILHVPTTAIMLDTVVKLPEGASSPEECLLFAIFHFAIFSMSSQDCQASFEQTRDTLLQHFHYATRQALVNAAFVKTTELPVLQALVLFLIACRYSYDAQTYWILTGVTVRIAQRMGLHRDGEHLGLQPFEVELRRRLFYQIIPLDGIASQLAGTSVAVMPDGWSASTPLNINDDQIWPEMAVKPTEVEGATEMIFCLTRSSVGKLFVKISKYKSSPQFAQLADYKKAEEMIDEAEREVEGRFIRYCDIVNPLHFLTIALGRSAIDAMRLQLGLSKVRSQAVSNDEKRKLFRLSQKILETDSATYANTSVKKYMWHVKPFFAWGSWDALIFVLKTLKKSDLLSAAEVEAAWNSVEQVFDHHAELFESKRVLHVAIARLALKAWDANLSKPKSLERVFVTNLRQMSCRKQSEKHEGSPAAVDSSPLISSLSENTDHSWLHEFEVDSPDWTFWDQLVKNYQATASMEQCLFGHMQSPVK